MVFLIQSFLRNLEDYWPATKMNVNLHLSSTHHCQIYLAFSRCPTTTNVSPVAENMLTTATNTFKLV
ncbi:hypothetical protein J6590_080118 [Homalodisca vitripennis]|nr:hypothetical protein J6590_080118 [Homalodisca vitripennis]